MKLHYSIFLLLLIVQKAIGQDEIISRLHAERVKEKIYLHIDSSQIRYKLDPLESDETSDGLPLRNNTIWASRSNWTKLFIGFYNPYRQKVVVSQESEEDPINADSEKMINSLSTLLTTITVGSPIPYTSTIQGAPVAENFSPRVTSHAVGVVLDQISTPSIIQWYLQLSQTEYASCFRNNAMDSVLVKIGAIEKYINNKFEINYPKGSISIPNDLTIDNHAKKILNLLYEPTSRVDFSSNLNSANGYQIEFKKIPGKVKNLVTELRSKINTIVWTSNSQICQAFKVYTGQVFGQYIPEIEKKISNIEEINKTLENLLKIGNEYSNKYTIKNFDGDIKRLIYNDDIEVSFKEIKNVSIKVENLVINTSNQGELLVSKNSYTKKFKLFRHRASWPEVSTGLFYSNIEYPTFSTVEDNSIVKVSDPIYKHPRVLAALLYNQVFNINSYPLYPHFQLGIATGRDYPTLLVGGGFRIVSNDTKRFSISGGAAIPFTQELKTLKAGESIVKGQADIDNDLQYRLGDRIGFYVGLSWKL
jgi:hypothetical protein